MGYCVKDLQESNELASGKILYQDTTAQLREKAAEINTKIFNDPRLRPNPDEQVAKGKGKGKEGEK